MNEKFINETAKIKAFLAKVKKECDAYDLTGPNEKQQKDFVDKKLPNLAKSLDRHFLIVWGLIGGLPEPKMEEHRFYYQRELHPYFEVSPYNKRVYEKPLGYPGDFIIMLYLYDNKYEGDTTYAKLIHRYSMRIPAARANHNRKDFYKRQITEIITKEESPAILSVACGPAKEIIEILAENPSANKAKYTCLDFEDLALQYVKEQVALEEEKKNCHFDVFLVKVDMLKLLKYEKIKDLFEDQDLIFSSGLIDYFSDKIAEKIIKVLFKKVKKGGKLILGNVLSPDRHRAYTEILGEWYIHYRTKGNMLKLTETIKDEKVVKMEYEPETKRNMFLIINKP